MDDRKSELNTHTPNAVLTNKKKTITCQGKLHSTISVVGKIFGHREVTGFKLKTIRNLQHTNT